VADGGACDRIGRVEPDEMTLLSEHCGTVEAPLSQVRELLLRVPTGRMKGSAAPLVLAARPDAVVVIDGGPAVFEAVVSGVPETIEVDRDAGWVQRCEPWWRCLHFQGQPHPDGTLIIQRTYSHRTGRDADLVVATLARWHATTGRQALSRLLDELASLLACRTHLLPT
jgi:hypothetical protein